MREWCLMLKGLSFDRKGLDLDLFGIWISFVDKRCCRDDLRLLRCSLT